MRYIKKFEGVKSDIFVSNRSWKSNYKITPEIEDKLPYKEGDIVEVHVGYYGQTPIGDPDDIHEIMEIVFARWNGNSGSDKMVVYAVKYLGADDDSYFEVLEKDIVRKLYDYEVSSLKYNL